MNAVARFVVAAVVAVALPSVTTAQPAAPVLLVQVSGQTVTAFWASVRHLQPLAVGLNCALGATLMRPYIQELAKVAGDTFISCYPNAGLPNPMSETGFDETPEITGALLEEFAKAGFLNIAGGCCGTTPEHIAQIAQRVGRYRPRCCTGPLFAGLKA